MDDKWFGHIILFGCLHKANQGFNGCVLVVMATAAGIGLLVNATLFQAGLGIHEAECMAV